ncbi:MAG: 4Fe-4S dicluster domain-containing protein [Pseudomonadota bacterium]
MAGKKDKPVYQASARLLEKFPNVSGNTVNGLDEPKARAPSPFFWHPPDKQAFGDLQQFIVGDLRPASGEDHSFRNPAVDRGPSPVEVARTVVQRDAAEWTEKVHQFSLANEADLCGITSMKPHYVYNGYAIDEPTVIILGVGHDYEELAKAPPTVDDLSAYHELHKQYNRGARVANRLTNYIREQGYKAQSYPGPMADALAMIPAAIDSGLGELGKHGSMINRQFGSAFRLSAVTTDMPLDLNEPDEFGADEFCLNCQVCRNACPPDAIFNEKKMVRGELKWYVDFDSCIPYFGENFACGICIAVCPWSRPGIAENLIRKMAKRRAKGKFSKDQ